MFSTASAFVASPSAAQELKQLIRQRDAYTYALCYYEDALDYAIANLNSDNSGIRKFAKDIAWEFVNLRLYGHEPAKELELLAALRETSLSHCEKFDVAVVQMYHGSKACLGVLFEEFKARKCGRGSRELALQFLLMNDVRPCKSLFVATGLGLDDEYEVVALTAFWQLGIGRKSDIRDYESILVAGLADHYEVAAFAALGLHRIGNDKGVQWLIERIRTQPPRTWPESHVLGAIRDAKLKEAVPLLKTWLTYRKPDELEFETTANRVQIALVLATIGDKEGEDFLRKILMPPRPNITGVVGKTALCLARLGDRTSIPAMTEALKTAGGFKWVNLAESLLILKDPDVVRDLMQNIREDSSWSQHAADLAIKYRIRRALPLLQERFDKKNQKSEFAKIVQEDPMTLAYVKQTGTSEQQYVDRLYAQAFHRCRKLALGILDMQPEKGKQNVLMLLRRDDLHSVEHSSFERLLDRVAEHHITEAVPYLIPILDSPDPLRRRASLNCLRQLTGRNLPPISEAWRRVTQVKNK